MVVLIFRKANGKQVRQHESSSRSCPNLSNVFLTHHATNLRLPNRKETEKKNRSESKSIYIPAFSFYSIKSFSNWKFNKYDEIWLLEFNYLAGFKSSRNSMEERKKIKEEKKERREGISPVEIPGGKIFCEPGLEWMIQQQEIGSIEEEWMKIINWL